MMRISSINVKSSLAFGLFLSSITLLSNHAAWATDVDESQVQQMADSMTAQQIDDEVRSGARDIITGQLNTSDNGGPSNNSISNGELRALDYEQAIEANFPRVQPRISSPGLHEWTNSDPLWKGFKIFSVNIDAGPRITHRRVAVTFPRHYIAIGKKTAACIKKQVSEFSKVPGGLSSQLKAREAELHFYFLTLEVNDESAELLRGLGKNSKNLFASYEESPDSDERMESKAKNTLKLFAHIDLEGNCHVTAANDILKPYDDKIKANEDAEKRREKALRDLNEELAPAEASAPAAN